MRTQGEEDDESFSCRSNNVTIGSAIVLQPRLYNDLGNMGTRRK